MNNKVWKEDFSKFLSFLLRHHPEVLDLCMDEHGWVKISELIEKLNMQAEYRKVTLCDIQDIVETNNKKRFIIENREGVLYIRANQGHSLKNIDLDLPITKPLNILYHGTGEKYVKSILKQGLKAKSRQHVHLSDSISVALKVGQRHGKPVIFKVDSEQMYKDGVSFYLSANNVWLTDYVDPKYLEIIKE